jgi:acetyl esterase/lipase
MRSLILAAVFFVACNSEGTPEESPAYKITTRITYNNVNVDVIIDKPAVSNPDVLIVFHGTVQRDNEIITAANTALDEFKNILSRPDMMLVSVAHPQENILFGDNIIQAEAALLWVKNKSNEELGITVGKIFLAGHSQGGYLVTRLNTMYQTNGVIASAPGPLDLVYRCNLEESGQVQPSAPCFKLKNAYGLASTNPDAYFGRSLLNFAKGFKSDILFVQGLDDSPIQLYSWPAFKQAINSCTNCQESKFVEIAGGHNALFVSSLNTLAKAEFNNFINNH